MAATATTRARMRFRSISVRLPGLEDRDLGRNVVEAGSRPEEARVGDVPVRREVPGARRASGEVVVLAAVEQLDPAGAADEGLHAAFGVAHDVVLVPAVA